MAIIAEYDIDTPVMKKAAEAVPEMVFRTEDMRLLQVGDAKHLFWASGGDFDVFEAALETDPTIEQYRRLADSRDRQLYRVTYTNEGRQQLTYPKAFEFDIIYLVATTTYKRTRIRARFPDRTILKVYRKACEDRGVPFQLRRLHQEDHDSSASQYGLTSRQQRVLMRAHEQGYFNDPRDTTLEELAGEFDISPSALGRQLRRAEDALIKRTIRSLS
jgi:predicted DNA binding protein